jgi:hypothetical protein
MNIVEVARTQLGVHEATGRNDGIPAERYMRGDKLAWCAGFVLYCIDRSSSAHKASFSLHPVYYACRAVSGFVEVAKTLGLYRPRDGYTPKPGDVIFFANATSDVGRPGNHVGIVEDVDVHQGDGKGERVHTIEGNTSNKVARRDYAVDDTRILGYCCMQEPTE